LQDVLKREMDKVGIDIEGAPLRGHPLPIYLRHETLQRSRVLLAGDAAGLMDPLLGEGIRYAVKSGQLAAQAILSGDLSGYSSRIHREIGDDLLWGLRWAHAFYKHPHGSFELGVRNPWFVEEFLRLFSGRSSYRQMALHALPKVLLGIRRLTPTSAPADASQEPF
jgi:flavin-dependent dehydrogenase